MGDDALAGWISKPQQGARRIGFTVVTVYRGQRAWRPICALQRNTLIGTAPVLANVSWVSRKCRTRELRNFGGLEGVCCLVNPMEAARPFCPKRAQRRTCMQQLQRALNKLSKCASLAYYSWLHLIHYHTTVHSHNIVQSQPGVQKGETVIRDPRIEAQQGCGLESEKLAVAWIARRHHQ